MVIIYCPLYKLDIEGTTFECHVSVKNALKSINMFLSWLHTKLFTLQWLAWQIVLYKINDCGTLLKHSRF